jgi:hypothetical protein
VFPGLPKAAAKRMFWPSRQTPTAWGNGTCAAMSGSSFSQLAPRGDGLLHVVAAAEGNGPWAGAALHWARALKTVQALGLDALPSHQI